MLFFAAVAAYYFPGDRYDTGQVACPKVPAELRAARGFAHRSAPCGSKALICYKLRCAVGVVADRGPYGILGAQGWRWGTRLGPKERWAGEFDLWHGLAAELDFRGKEPVQYTWLKKESTR